MTTYFNGRYHMIYQRSVIYMLYFATNSVLTYGLNPFAGGVFFCTNSSLTTSSGTLYSENYPMSYNDSRYCESNIFIKDAILIEISFEYFHTESYSDLNLMNDMCNLDYLEITANGRSLRVCGDWTGRESRLYFTVNSSSVNLKFHSNEDKSKSGFVLKWTSMLKFEERTTCSYSQHYLHETETSCFEVITQPEDWLTGHESCRRRGASLARIEDLQTQTELETSLYKRQLHNDAIWIGANDRLFEGDYMWPDRSSINYTNWFPGWRLQSVHDTSQPSDDGFSNEDCVEIKRVFSYPDKGTGLTNSFFWNDRNCLEKNPFICQFDKRIRKRSTEHEMTVCGEMVNLTTDRPAATVTSPNFPAMYPELVTCHTIITVPKGNQIYVNFLYFDTEYGKECDFDNVTITESWSKSSRGPFCGNWNQKLKLLRMVSVSNEIVITFQSDNTRQFDGFKIQVSLVEPAQLCLGDGLAMPSGDITATPLYNMNECIILTNGTRNYTESIAMCAAMGTEVASVGPVTSHILAYNVKEENACIEVWSSATNSSLITNHLENNDTLCNVTRICKNTTEDTSVYVTTETEVDDLNISCSYSRQTVCRKSRKNTTVLTMPSQSGEFAHFCPNGKNYSNDVTLIQNFVASIGYRIIFKLHSYDIEFQENCLYDALQTSGMSENQRFCGKSLHPVTFISERETASLEFNTDNDVTACGFNLSWHWVKADKAFHTQFITPNTHGFITSVNYPNAFPDKIDKCLNWTIPQDSRMLLELQNLTLPGTNCDYSQFEIYSNSETLQTFCGGDSLEHVNAVAYRVLLLESSDVRFCLYARRLEALTGLNMEFKIVPTSNTTISRAVTLSPSEHIQVTSLMYPLKAPALITQGIAFRTQIGYKISIELHNITISSVVNCSDDYIEIIDNSLKANSDVKMTYSCVNLTNDTTSIIEHVRFSSVLNTVTVRITTGRHATDLSSLSFIATVTSIKDVDYLENTKHISGSFDECSSTTCKNGGECSSTADNRFTCSCPAHYTGLFCQVNKCDLRPCQHGRCNLTDTGFQCHCDVNYFGQFCNMSSTMCETRMCSGNGQCVATSDHGYRCVCDARYTGNRCDIAESASSYEKEELTIGQKLLKEPIWIGMIVIVNLVIFFCISYVIRRKCGKKIAKLFPKRNKAAIGSKENSKAEPSVQSNANSERISDRNIYSISLETPKISTGSLWSGPRRKFREKLHSDSISTPSTPVVTEQNQDAAMKLFASYNSRKDQLTPNITSLPSETTSNLSLTARNIMSCGIKGGMLTLNRENDSDNYINESPHGILRSYTISTEIRDFESRYRYKDTEGLHKARSYSGTPFRYRPASSVEEDDSKEIENTPKVLKQRHCYPEIRIINEHNMEETKKSDSEVSAVDIHLDEVELDEDIADEIEIKPLDNTDSGYRSTTISNTTHSESFMAEPSEINGAPTASEKRKMFSSKSKSASFYNIATAEMSQPSARRSERNSSNVTSPNSRHPSSMDCLSFDSGNCSCHRESINRCSYSYDKDLDKIHNRRGRLYSHDVSNQCSRHKKHKRKRYSTCRHHSHGKEIGWYPRPFLFPSTSSRHEQCMHFTSRHMSISDTRDTKRHHHGSRMVNSSTESDSCLCSTHENRRHSRRHYHKPNLITEAFSEGDYHQRRIHDSKHGHNYETPFCKDLKDDDSYKSNLMKSFLSDTYRAKYKGYSGQSFVSDDIRSSSTVHPSRTSSGSSIDALSPNPAQFPISLSRRSDTVLELSDDSILKLNVSPSLLEHDRVSSRNEYPGVFLSSDSFAIADSHEAESNVDDFGDSMQSTTYISSQANPTFSTLEYNSNTVITDRDGSLEGGIDENEAAQSNVLTKLKDSAYQTKQSSIDKFRGDKPLSSSGSLKARSISVESNSSNDVTVRRYLHQAALKLALLKRLQNTRQISKDSAINTFSEDDLSADEKDPRGPFRPLVKRTSGSLAFQLGEMSLSEVKEEHSGGLSKDTESYNTPNNEPVVETTLERVAGDGTVTSAREMHELSKPSHALDHAFRMDETKV